jgi:hypothetical protein
MDYTDCTNADSTIRGPPLSHLVYYRNRSDTLSVLALIHDRRHPDHLRPRPDDSSE